MRSFRTVIDRYDATATVALIGDLDTAEIEAFERTMRSLEAEGHTRIVLDMVGFELIDSHGPSALIDADARAHSKGHEFLLTRPPRRSCTSSASHCSITTSTGSSPPIASLSTPRSALLLTGGPAAGRDVSTSQ
jgi:anti-anti-sigma factor